MNRKCKISEIICKLYLTLCKTYAILKLSLKENCNFQILFIGGIVMKMWIIGFLLAVLSVTAIGAIIYITAKDNKKIKDTYDERQQIARGEAGKYGFIAAMCGLVVLLVMDLFAAEKKLNVTLIIPIMVIASISLGVFGCVCIWKDAWLMLYQNPKKTVISSLSTCIINYLLAFLNYFNHCYSFDYGSALDKESFRDFIIGRPFEVNIPDFSITYLYVSLLNFLVATVLLVLIVNYLVKYALDKSREKSEMNEKS